MALNAARDWLICYDIRDKRRLSRLHRFLTSVAAPVQYSVFSVRDTPAKIGQLARAIEERIKLEEDDVRIYPVPDAPQLYLLGRQILDIDGATLAGGDLLAALAGKRVEG